MIKVDMKRELSSKLTFVAKIIAPGLWIFFWVVLTLVLLFGVDERTKPPSISAVKVNIRNWTFDKIGCQNLVSGRCYQSTDYEKEQSTELTGGWRRNSNPPKLPVNSSVVLLGAGLSLVVLHFTPLRRSIFVKSPINKCIKLYFYGP